MPINSNADPMTSEDSGLPQTRWNDQADLIEMIYRVEQLFEEQKAQKEQTKGEAGVLLRLDRAGGALTPKEVADTALAKREVFALAPLFLSPRELYRLPAGLLRLDRRGRVIAASSAEANSQGQSNRPEPSLIGQPFFSAVAPWAHELEQAFFALVQEGSAVRILKLDRVIPLPEGPCRVSLVITPAQKPGQFLVSIVREEKTS